MGAWSLAGILLAFLAVCIHGQELHMEISADRVPEGSGVTLRCTLTGTGKINMVYWYKKQGSDFVHLATNNIPEDGYEFDRYVYDMEEGPDGAVIFLLNIDGVINGDSGEFGCESPQIGTDISYVSLVVTKPVEKIRLFAMPGNDSSQPSIREYEDGEHVDFVENDLYFFKCAVAGSNPTPNMRITLGEYNITDRFVMEDLPTTVGDEPPFNDIEHTTFLTTTQAIKVHHEGNALEFRCSAWVDDTEPISIHIVPVLKFAPVIDCPDYVRVPIDTEDLNLECVVRAEPVCNDIDWMFFRKDNSNITLDPIKNPTWGNFYLTLHPGEHSDRIIARLNIEHVFFEHFRSYKLTARTELGTTEHVLTLERDEEAESAGGGATSLIASLTLLLAALTGGTLYRRL